MANWDVFHAERLELERGLTTSAIREALARGDVREDDLARPAGTTAAWARLADLPDLLTPGASPPQSNVHVSAPTVTPSTPPSVTVSAAAPSAFELVADETGPSRSLPTMHEPIARAREWIDLGADSDDVSFPVLDDDALEPKSWSVSSKKPDVPPPVAWQWASDDDDNEEEVDEDFDGQPEVIELEGADDLEILDDDEPDENADGPVLPDDRSAEKSDASAVALPVVALSHNDEAGALADIPEEDEFSLSRSGPMTVEELDLAPMVDVAFQLVLFFMVAAQTVLYKTLEIPKPSPEQAPAAVAQGRSRSLDDLKEDYILVEIDASGGMRIDREPVAADTTALVERLRSAREATHRKAMLLSAEYATTHRNTVLAYDAANEIGLGIVIARPASPQGPAPGLLPGQPAAPAAVKPAPAPAQVPN